MADVFISYAKAHVELTRALAQELEEKGVTVWWDTDLIAGESFRDRIVQEIKDCKAAIVIWTLTSVHSPFVLSEAERARTGGRVMGRRFAGLHPGSTTCGAALESLGFLALFGQK
jgi:TIR domain